MCTVSRSRSRERDLASNSSYLCSLFVTSFIMALHLATYSLISAIVSFAAHISVLSRTTLSLLTLTSSSAVLHDYLSTHNSLSRQSSSSFICAVVWQTIMIAYKRTSNIRLGREATHESIYKKICGDLHQLRRTYLFECCPLQASLPSVVFELTLLSIP